MVAEVSNKAIIQQRKRLYSLEEYYELEEKANFRSEFVNGKIIPMPGGTHNHNRIISTLIGLFFIFLNNREDDYELFSGDQTVYLPKFDRVVYPDVCVALEKAIAHENHRLGIINPTLVVEVASKSTERYDRSGKFRLYQSLPSFKEYVLVHQDMPIVEVLVKIEENKWQMTTYTGLDKTVELETLGVSLKMSDIYKKAEDLQDPQTIFDFPEET
ncbi:MAG: Uma2 family endonuclease [Saprospiraceae bacterium]